MSFYLDRFSSRVALFLALTALGAGGLSNRALAQQPVVSVSGGTYDMQVRAKGLADATLGFNDFWSNSSLKQLQEDFSSKKLGSASSLQMSISQHWWDTRYGYGLQGYGNLSQTTLEPKAIWKGIKESNPDQAAMNQNNWGSNSWSREKLDCMDKAAAEFRALLALRDGRYKKFMFETLGIPEVQLRLKTNVERAYPDQVNSKMTYGLRIYEVSKDPVELSAALTWLGQCKYMKADEMAKALEPSVVKVLGASLAKPVSVPGPVLNAAAVQPSAGGFSAL